MRVIEARNVHDALPLALELLFRHGVFRESRNGPVLMMDTPVTTVYAQPLERVVFWEERDANPFFHLYESLWMLDGRNDVAGVARYAKQMLQYSDDGKTLHGAYGHRWRWRPEDRDSRMVPFDQLTQIALMLNENPNDRRAVLSMWNAGWDLGRKGKDIPCNVTATFQIGTDGCLHLVVFNRSNDIVWGCYGANAVHFSFLLEYVALAIGALVGTYTQISVNWHGYVETIEPLRTLPQRALKHLHAVPTIIPNPYRWESTRTPVKPLRLSYFEKPPMEWIDEQIRIVLQEADNDFKLTIPKGLDTNFTYIHHLLRAYHLYKTLPEPERFERAMDLIECCDCDLDFPRACGEWIGRRKAKWEARMKTAEVTGGNPQ